VKQPNDAKNVNIHVEEFMDDFGRLKSSLANCFSNLV